MTILVTGAAGKTGRALIRALAGRREAARALVHRTDQVPIVHALGACESLAGDMRESRTLQQAMEGVRAVYHICPNLSPGESAIAGKVIAAARAAGVRHLVYHSVLHPQTEAMPHHWQKLRAEEQILESGVAYTILQPAAYMQNVLAYWDGAARDGVYRVPYARGTRLSMVDLEDVAEAASVVLTCTGHEGATYELCGSETLSQDEVAAEMGRSLGRSVRAEAVPLEEWEHEARAARLSDYQVATLLSMFRYYERCGFGGNHLVLSWLLRRPPATFAAFCRRTAHVRGSQGEQRRPLSPRSPLDARSVREPGDSRKSGWR